MHAAAPLAPALSERLTWAQICERYPDQHVYVANAERDDPFALEFRHAMVVACGATRQQAVDQACVRWDGGSVIEHRFTGRPTSQLRRPTVFLVEDHDAL
jgi:hypothetical protein